MAELHQNRCSCDFKRISRHVAQLFSPSEAYLCVYPVGDTFASNAGFRAPAGAQKSNSMHWHQRKINSYDASLLFAKEKRYRANRRQSWL